MIRISGINIPDNKRIEIALTYIYGVGRTTSQKVLAELDIDPTIRTKDITDADAKRIREKIEGDYSVEGELRHKVKMNIRRLQDIGCYRGTRHAKGLPVRGQRTKTNNRTVRGNKRTTMGSGKISVSKT